MGTPEYPWRETFLAALSDTTSQQFSQSLEEADDAVFRRLWEIEMAGGYQEERAVLESTMQDIRLLRSNSYHLKF